MPALKETGLALLLLAALAWLEHGLRKHEPTPDQFNGMVGLEDCATTYLDDALLRKQAHPNGGVS